MSKLKTMETIYKMNEAFNKGNISEMVLLAGMTEKMIDEMNMQEVLDALSVRIHDMVNSVMGDE